MTAVVVVDPALASRLVAGLAVDAAGLADAELAQQVGRTVVADAHGRVVLLVEIDVAARGVERHGLPGEEARAHEHLPHATGPVVARDEPVVGGARKCQLPCLADRAGAVTVALGHAYRARVGLHAAVPARAVPPGLRVPVLGAVAEVLHDLRCHVRPADSHFLHLPGASGGAGNRAEPPPVVFRAVEEVEVKVPAVAGYAPGARVLEDQRRGPRPEVPAVGPRLGEEPRLLVVRVLRHPQGVGLGHAGPVIGEKNRLARVDARRHSGLGLYAVQPRLRPGHAQVQRVRLPVQERDRLARVRLEGRNEVVSLRLGRALVPTVARVVVAAEQLARSQRLVRVPTEALVRVARAAGRLHDHEVAGAHGRDDQVVLPGADVDAVKPHAPHPSGSPACRRRRRARP